MDRLKTIATNICRILLALTFILSGFVKAVDPLGTQYKIHDYAEAVGANAYIADWMEFGASIGLSAFEFVIGIALLFAIRRRLTSAIALAFTAVMTLITVWIAIANPVSDCGCFGDALKLSNTATLAKNVCLLAFAVVVAMSPLRTKRMVSRSNQGIVMNYSIFFIIVIEGYCLYSLPIFDFRPYHIGVNIWKDMQIPDDAPQPEFETTFIMKKGDVEKEFTIENYPDSTWTFVDSKTKMVKKGYVPPIHDFSIQNAKGDDLTEEILKYKGYTFLLVSPHLENADDGSAGDIDFVNQYAQDHGYRFYCLTASTEKAIAHWADITGAEYAFLHTDETTLKTVIRSNPGLLLLKNGTIIGKWSHNSLPGKDLLSTSLDNIPTTALQRSSVGERVAKIFLWFVLPLLILTIADRLWAWRKWLKEKTSKTLLYKLIFKKKNTMRKKIVAGNWKMNMNLQDGVALAKELNEALTNEKPNCDVVICTPFIHLASIAQILDQNVIGLGAENCADKEKGAFTGEVSAEMVKSTGAQYVILGHSERRGYYGETPEILKEKVLLALKNGLKVIFCIGESLEEREANKQNEVVKAELEGSVFNLTEEEFKNIVIAYEPIWAIGTGKTATAEQAEEIHAYIRSIVAGKYGEKVADETSILYGGSCKASNAPELFAKPDIDGGLIGGASLKAADFRGIIDAWKK